MLFLDLARVICQWHAKVVVRELNQLPDVSNFYNAFCNILVRLVVEWKYF